jgi:hypothetical protein
MSTNEDSQINNKSKRKYKLDDIDIAILNNFTTKCKNLKYRFSKYSGDISITLFKKSQKFNRF